MHYTALVTYYTRSRNTAHLAEIAATVLSNCGWEVTQMPIDKAVKTFPAKTPDLVILGTAVQYWTIPSAAMEWIEQLPDLQGSCAFVYSCYGGCVSNNVPFDLATAVTAKRATVIGGAQFLTPHSCRINGKQRIGDLDEKFGKGQPNEKTVAEFSDAIAHMTRLIESGNVVAVDMDKLKINTMGFWASAINPVSPLPMKRAFMPPVVVDQTKCDGCGACTRVCDTGSIRVDNDKTTHILQKTCYRCYGCLEACPNDALTTNWKKAEVLVRLMKSIAKDATRSVIFLPET